MWTAELKSKSRVNGMVVFVVDYTNGVDTATRSYQISSPGTDFLKSQVTQELRNLNDLDTYFDSISVGVVDTTPTTIPVETKERNQFFDNYLKLNSLKIAVEKGLLDGNDQELANLETLVSSKFKLEYTADLRWK